ncbi:MAG: bifunctional oligoribonuclease/PAP phosphatase NrnA, partial [Candidatus Micrarchaeota archaeon]|nr:bifunctional oligoribonuclease/PAP phosphatase NrnA [Candidatus Micrarchaeota archaeon]
SGADLALVGTSDSHGARLSARLRPALSRRVHLPYLCHQMGQLLGGNGGGHPAAGGATGPNAGKLAEALRLGQKLFLQEIGKS